MFAAIFFMVPILAICDDRRVQNVFFVLSFLAAGAFLLVANAAWFELIGIPCPRCGEHFTAAFGMGYLRNRCKHCDLELGPAPMAKAKPPAGADLVE